MLGKLLGNKKSKYYLELSEDEIAAVPEPPAKLEVAVAPAVAANGDAPAAEPGEAAVAAAPLPVPALAPSVSKAAAAMPQEAAVPAAMSDPVELIQTALAAAANKPAAAPEAPKPTFDYTAPVAKAKRRRPGPSMAPFKTIAKDMKKTTAGF